MLRRRGAGWRTIEGVESVLVIGWIRSDRNDDVDALLAAGGLGSRAYRQGELLALLVESPQAETRFLGLLRDGEGAFARLISCFEDVPLLPPEVTARSDTDRQFCSGHAGAAPLETPWAAPQQRAELHH